MGERGWGWTNSQIRQARLVEWLAQAGGDVQVEPFYAGLPDWLSNEDWLGDVKALSERGLIGYSYPLAGVVGWVTPAGQDEAEALRAMRADTRKRRIACRDAMVAWLCSCDATSPHPTRRKLRDAMLAEPRFGVWFAEPFAAEDLDEAAGWLHRQGLVEGLVSDQCRGPGQLSLTDAGVECAENFGSDTRRYMEAKNAPSRSGRTVNIGANSGLLQVAGDNASQVQNIGQSAEHLRDLITRIAELVRQQAPNPGEIDAEQQAALAAASNGGVDQTALRRFGAWALSALGAGATAATVAEVSALITAMFQVIAHMMGHVG